MPAFCSRAEAPGRLISSILLSLPYSRAISHLLASQAPQVLSVVLAPAWGCQAQAWHTKGQLHVFYPHILLYSHLVASLRDLTVGTPCPAGGWGLPRGSLCCTPLPPPPTSLAAASQEERGKARYGHVGFSSCPHPAFPCGSFLGSCGLRDLIEVSLHIYVYRYVYIFKYTYILYRIKVFY